MTYWTRIVKPEVLKGIEDAGITDKSLIKNILTYERRIVTCQNMLINGVSWENMIYSQASNDASMLQDDLLENDDYLNYQECRGFFRGATFGDSLA